MTVLVACDLDGTLIYSARALRLPAGDVELVCVETLNDEPASFLTVAAEQGLTTLGSIATLVAVTVRSPEQLARVRLPGASRYAVAANGGRLFVDGVLDEGWSRRVAALVADQWPYAHMRRHVASVEEQGWLHRSKGVEDLFCYGIVDLATLPADAVEREAEYAAALGWRVSLQGRKLYWVPTGLDKSAAVAELARRLPATTVLAAGDSGLDAELLRTADRAIRPAHGELHRAGWTAPGLEITANAGARAGTEIVEWLLGVARSARAAPTLLAPATNEQQHNDYSDRGVAAFGRPLG